MTRKRKRDELNFGEWLLMIPILLLFIVMFLVHQFHNILRIFGMCRYIGRVVAVDRADPKKMRFTLRAFGGHLPFIRTQAGKNLAMGDLWRAWIQDRIVYVPLNLFEWIGMMIHALRNRGTDQPCDHSTIWVVTVGDE